MDHRYILTNNIHLHVVQDGPPDGPLLILLHGFPEFWYGWRRQIPLLASAGYRVWAPDQRGYNLSDKPRGIAAYSLDQLAADVVGLIDAAGEQQAFLVGHDWGGAVAWRVAASYPERLRKLIILNTPHGSVMAKNLRQNRAQLRKSWYMLAFQIPWLPEFITRLRNWELGTEALRKSSLPGTFSAADLDEYRKAWARPNAYHSMLNWYRAAIQKPPSPPANRRISVPTLLIWGAKDRFFEQTLAQPSIDRCDDGELVIIEGATHWVQHEEAERVNGLIGAFFAGE
jgi:pimeloyl-ACP methyl ester carboxylesterase